MKGHPIGTRVVIVRGSHMFGVVACVLSEPEPATCGNAANHQAGLCWCSDGLPLVQRLSVKAKMPGTVVGYPPSWLEPLRNDGHEKATWDGLEWIKRSNVRA